MFSKDGVRDSYRQVLKTLESLNLATLNQKQKQASDIFMNQGITFTVYSDDDQGIERIFHSILFQESLPKANGQR